MRRIPATRWGAAWLVALALIAGGALGLERFVRARGYQPSVKDDEYSWAWERTRVDGSDRVVAVLGTSRIMLAFSGETFHAELPGWRFVQLGINGTMPLGSLHDLAADPDFHGVALVDSPEDAFPEVALGRQDSYLAAYHRRWRAPGAMAERWLATQVQSHVAVVSAAGMRALSSLFEGHGWPRPPYVVTHADRTQFADFALRDTARRRADQLERLGTGAPGDETAAQAWLAEALAHEPAVEAIQARGGKVVYLRMPTCDERWAAEEVWRPRALFWDRFAARTQAVALHFKDLPELATLACPDTSHIASKDGPRFTRAVIEALIARGVIAR